MPFPSLDDLLAIAAQDGRVCPKPHAWTALYELLPDVRHDTYGFIPAPPLVAEFWDRTSDGDKRERLREHLLWAAGHGAAAKVHAWMVLMPPDAWHREGG